MNKEIEQFIRQNYPIQTGLNNPILRKVSQKIEKFDEELKNFSKIMFDAMVIYDGIGLAAPQIGVNKRIVVISQLDKKGKNILFSDVLINPEIVEKSETLTINEEGCLSLPGMEGEVARPEKVKVKYQDVNGKYHEINAKGLNAAIIQHEIDHLDGILFWDKVKGKQDIDLKKFMKI